MQSYIVNIKKIPKNYYMLKSLSISNFNKYSIEKEEITLNILIGKNEHSIKIYVDDNFKPSFILISSQIENVILNQQIENLNSYIDDFENFQDLIYEIKNLLEKVIKTKEEPVIQIKNKDVKLFKENLELIKNSYTQLKDNNKNQTNSNSELFSFRSKIEMLGDQYLKIYMDERFDIEEITNLENIIIVLSNFTGLTNLEVKVVMCVDLDWVKKPPVVILKSNMVLSDNILGVIEKLKPFADTKSWSIKYSIYDTIVNIYNMINTYGEIQCQSSNNLEIVLSELEYLFSLKDKQISQTKLLELFDKNLVHGYENNQNQGSVSKFSQNTKEYWKKGTGYGHDNNLKANWDIEEYVSNLNNKKKNINIKFSSLIDVIILGESIIDHIDKVLKIFEQYINHDEQESILLVKIADIIKIKNLSLENKSVWKIIQYLKEHFEENNIVHELFKEKKTEIIIKNNTNEKFDEYQKKLYEYKFKFIDTVYNNFYFDSLNTNSSYSNNIVKNNTINSNQISRLQKEFVILKKSITIDKDASIFFSVDKQNIFKMRFIISGPKGTPYSYGLFLFDMTFTNEFPQKPPIVHFLNHGNKRFNPNLYDCGKVCLSLLGTWNSSNKGETWNSTISTFNQVLISIQSLILIDEPYFNEPGHEKSIGTPHGNEKSKNYNYTIRKYTLDHTINDLIEDILSGKNRYKEFEYVIRNHFIFHANNIKKQNEIWLNEMPDNQKNIFKISMDKFDFLINKIIS